MADIQGAARTIESMAANFANKDPSGNEALKVFNQVYEETNGFLKKNPFAVEDLQAQLDKDREANPQMPKIDVGRYSIFVRLNEQSDAVFGRSRS
jgi:hypothetical protein